MVNWADMLECYASFIMSTEQSSFRLSLLLWLSSFYALIGQPTHSVIRSVGRSIVQLVNQMVKPSASQLVCRLVDRSVSQSAGYSVIRSIGQSASQCEKIVVLASKFRFLEFLVLETCRLKAWACTCTGNGSVAIEIDSARKPLWHVFVYTSNRPIFVYTFCFINICLSLSNDANKIKTLNIERA